MINLPTDNLYKFMAIFGLVITLSSAYYIDKYQRDLNHTIIDVNAEQESLKHEMEYYKDRRERLEEYLRGLTDQEKWIAVADDLYKNELELKKTSARAAANWEKMERMDNNWLFASGWAGVIGIWLGLALMVFGFGLWYMRVQVPLDWQMARSAWGEGENQGSDAGKGNEVEGVVPTRRQGDSPQSGK